MIETIDLFAPLREGSDLAGWLGACSTRSGGTSSAPFDSLNLGFSTGDEPDRVRENRTRLAGALGLSVTDWVVPGQCHGADVCAVGLSDRGEGVLAPSSRLRGHDAVLLEEPGVFALSLSADCPVVVIVDPENRRGGVAHAGWRGTAAGVVEALLFALKDRGTDPRECVAAVGPGICGDCFEVGDEVFDAVAARPGALAATQGRRLDLRRIHRAILEQAGIDGARIAIASHCSHEEFGRFYSHRRDLGRTGRNGVVAGWMV